MAHLNQKWDRMLRLMFEHPGKAFAVREISRKTGIPASSAQRYLKKLRQAGLVTKGNMPETSAYFKFRKAFFIISRLFETGLINYLEEKLSPSAIIVFGSARKGEYSMDSDIDLFVETTKPADINLKQFEKKLSHKIQLFVEKNINGLPDELFNSVVNGIKLSGYLKLK